ncbi:hypothetical protein H6F88_01915 [Oculatella sp. FACHB-28]|uniref:hypothetical protein n=1 Tax=Oculatella sp. FACHB-28 TaxID=2692845 RepID=UPI001682A04E|nr:hypothetical protein [Oculatella sp. FACHB-28]MBD2054790.1 hypothetical protein [Oculatella sp. FACHB-28]
MTNQQPADISIEALDRRLTERLDRLSESVEILTDQVGRMTEGITKLGNLVTLGFQDLKRQSEKRDEQIDRLLSLLERLIPQG